MYLSDKFVTALLLSFLFRTAQKVKLGKSQAHTRRINISRATFDDEFVTRTAYITSHSSAAVWEKLSLHKIFLQQVIKLQRLHPVVARSESPARFAPRIRSRDDFWPVCTAHALTLQSVAHAQKRLT